MDKLLSAYVTPNNVLSITKTEYYEQLDTTLQPSTEYWVCTKFVTNSVIFRFRMYNDYNRYYISGVDANLDNETKTYSWSIAVENNHLRFHIGKHNSSNFFHFPLERNDNTYNSNTFNCLMFDEYVIVLPFDEMDEHSVKLYRNGAFISDTFIQKDIKKYVHNLDPFNQLDFYSTNNGITVFDHFLLDYENNPYNRWTSSKIQKLYFDFLHDDDQFYPLNGLRDQLNHSHKSIIEYVNPFETSYWSDQSENIFEIVETYDCDFIIEIDCKDYTVVSNEYIEILYIHYDENTPLEFKIIVRENGNYEYSNIDSSVYQSTNLVNKSGLDLENISTLKIEFTHNNTDDSKNVYINDERIGNIQSVFDTLDHTKLNRMTMRTITSGKPGQNIYVRKIITSKYSHFETYMKKIFTNYSVEDHPLYLSTNQLVNVNDELPGTQIINWNGLSDFETYIDTPIALHDIFCFRIRTIGRIKYSKYYAANISYLKIEYFEPEIKTQQVFELDLHADSTLRFKVWNGNVDNPVMEEICRINNVNTFSSYINDFVIRFQRRVIDIFHNGIKIGIISTRNIFSNNANYGRININYFLYTGVYLQLYEMITNQIWTEKYIQNVFDTNVGGVYIKGIDNESITHYITANNPLTHPDDPSKLLNHVTGEYTISVNNINDLYLDFDLSSNTVYLSLHIIDNTFTLTNTIEPKNYWLETTSTNSVMSFIIHIRNNVESIINVYSDDITIIDIVIRDIGENDNIVVFQHNITNFDGNHAFDTSVNVYGIENVNYENGFIFSFTRDENRNYSFYINGKPMSNIDNTNFNAFNQIFGQLYYDLFVVHTSGEGKFQLYNFKNFESEQNGLSITYYDYINNISSIYYQSSYSIRIGKNTYAETVVYERSSTEFTTCIITDKVISSEDMFIFIFTYNNGYVYNSIDLDNTTPPDETPVGPTIGDPIRDPETGGIGGGIGGAFGDE
tara:strand:- start:7042 stop:9924 length:2883 start_codon:yes stop_codon:yes gene_type:complete